MKRSSLVALALLAACTAPVEHPPGPAEMPRLPRQGTVVFLGDSITWQGDYLLFLEAHLRRRHPDWGVRLVNLGRRGETVPRARARLAREVLPLKPRLVVVLLGVNDGGQRRLDRGKLTAFVDNLQGLVQELRAGSRAEVALATPTAAAPADAPYNRMLAAMAAEELALGRRLGVAVIDLHHPLREQLARGPAGLMADALHPGPAGQLLIADLLARELHPRCEPLAGATARVDLEGREAPGVNVAVPGVNVYVPPAARPALPLLEPKRRAILLGEQRLVLDGVTRPLALRTGPCCKKAGRVVSLGSFSPAELQQGISLDVAGTPWVEQARRLHEILLQRQRWQRALGDPEAANTTRAEAGRLLERVQRELATLRPRPQRTWIELSPAPGGPGGA